MVLRSKDTARLRILSLSFSLFYSYSRRVVYVDVVVVLVFDIILKGKILGEFLHFPNIKHIYTKRCQRARKEAIEAKREAQEA